MFDIGWSELVVIAVVALIAIGPKELPGVLRMVGQWMGKARKMAAEFQGQFQEAMREAEMADLKKSFDEVREAASGFTGGNIMTSLQKDVQRVAPDRRFGQARDIQRYAGDINGHAGDIEYRCTGGIGSGSSRDRPARSSDNARAAHARNIRRS